MIFFFCLNKYVGQTFLSGPRKLQAQIRLSEGGNLHNRKYHDFLRPDYSVWGHITYETVKIKGLTIISNLTTPRAELILSTPTPVPLTILTVQAAKTYKFSGANGHPGNTHR
jgi:hypothetical protein